MTRDTRELIVCFLERNLPGAQRLYERVAKQNPRAALSVLVQLADFGAPRLQRSEVLAAVAPLPTEPISDASEAAAIYQALCADDRLDPAALRFGTTPALLEHEATP